MKTIDRHLEEMQIPLDELAERTGLSIERIEAIAVGRWTPGPEDRKKLAAGLEISVDEISWGHTISPRNIRYHQFGMPKDDE